MLETFEGKFSQDEWQTIRAGPASAGTLVMVSSPSGLTGLLAETQAIALTLRELGLASQTRQKHGLHAAPNHAAPLEIGLEDHQTVWHGRGAYGLRTHRQLRYGVGTLQIKLTVTDADGTQASDETTVNLTERPASEPLEITSPVSNAVFDQEETVVLRRRVLRQ